MNLQLCRLRCFFVHLLVIRELHCTNQTVSQRNCEQPTTTMGTFPFTLLSTDTTGHDIYILSFYLFMYKSLIVLIITIYYLVYYLFTIIN